ADLLVSLSYQTTPKSTPAELRALGGVDRWNAWDRMIGDELFAGVDADRLLAGLDVFCDRFDALRSHQQGVLLRGRSDDAVLDALDARTAATTSTPFSLPAASNAA